VRGAVAIVVFVFLLVTKHGLGKGVAVSVVLLIGFVFSGSIGAFWWLMVAGVTLRGGWLV